MQHPAVGEVASTVRVSKRSRVGAEIRVRGLVQGVGFRPSVWRLARDCGLTGDVCNDSDGVLIRAWGEHADLERFFRRMRDEAPPLARIDRVERRSLALPAPSATLDAFRIVASDTGGVRTGIVPDAATCDACRAEILDPWQRRYRYAFTNCTHCGPRLSIIEAIPYDRAATSMRKFALCPACDGEYRDPGDRRFHAQPIACPACGPRVWLERSDGAPIVAAAFHADDAPGAPAAVTPKQAPDATRAVTLKHALDEACAVAPKRAPEMPGISNALPNKHAPRAASVRVAAAVKHAQDAIDVACLLLRRGHIVAIKGLGGFQLACDACNDAAVARLRSLKRRERKPFALMARDLSVIRRYCVVGQAEEALLASAAAPIVVMAARESPSVSENVAPGVKTLGCMLPNTPLHHLLLRRLARPIVLTSGNLSDEPQSIDNDEARARLSGIADYFLMHDRDIVRRVDDSVVRVAGGAPRIVRRARGYAPAPLALPDGFKEAPAVLALGGELKNTFCLMSDGQAIVSHHMGDLENARTHADYRQSIDRYLQLFALEPRIVAVDLHPEYLSRKLGCELAQGRALGLSEVQHHHAHIAACMAENGIALNAAPVLGVALDGLGFGGDGTLWGGEFLRADYCTCTRLATFQPVAMPGGERAIVEPWRNTYAHLKATIGWEGFGADYRSLELYRFLADKPRRLLDGMIARGVNSPLASSCGRLFDAVAAAAGVCRDEACYEGQAAIEFEALVDGETLRDEDERLAYSFAVARGGGGADDLSYVEPLPMWQALLNDLSRGAPVPVIAARFHKGLAMIIVWMIEQLSERDRDAQGTRTIALSGGVFQNRVLLEQVVTRLEANSFRVLTHRQVPANDGGLSLGQAVVAAARALAS